MSINWSGKKVLVAGGAGMIGSHIARELLKRKAVVTVADDLSSGSWANIKDIFKDIDIFKCDLRSYTACKVATEGKDAVFQFAADMGGIGYITAVGAKLMANNSLINLNMLVASEAAGIFHYFYSSSACIYPEYRQEDCEVPPLKESDAYPAMPDQFYGWEKLYAEKLCESFIRDCGMNIKIARFHNVYGSAYTAFDNKRGKAPCHLILKAIRHPEPPFTIWGDGKCTRSFLYINDCVEAVLKMMDYDCRRPINIGSDRLITVNDLARIITNISGKEITPEYDLTKPQGVRGRNADLQFCKEQLKWQPKVPLEDGLKRVYEWAVEHYDELEGI